MTSAEIRQSFLDFFASKGHTIVPSSSLLPDSPGLLFTNAGMNQFVPIFLGDRAPDVSKWAGVRPARDTRAADTQKCIRAGGKHNDLEDVGFDTYHHTLFEMLGNWSFGDYFKKESLEWGWELITQVWGMPPKRLFATVYSPDKSKNDPSEFDQEAYDIWAGIFTRAGLDPKVHIVHGNKKDNFWMMGDTGPCGPCSEIHFNLLPSDDETEGRKLVNASSPRCIEIWNHVFIQFNAAPATPEDEAKMKAGKKVGEHWQQKFDPLAAKHVDTGMGFERVAGIYATTGGFEDFTKDPSNYAADIFTPIFSKVAELSGKTYTATVPTKREGLTEQENIDVAFRVLADHARCVSCAIADGINPGNDERNYVIRKILGRALVFGRKLDMPEGFFEQLVDPVAESLGTAFPELIERRDVIRQVVRAEEKAWTTKLQNGLELFARAAASLVKVGMLRDAAQQETESFVHILKTETFEEAEDIAERAWSHFVALRQIDRECRHVETIKMFGTTWRDFNLAVSAFENSLRTPTLGEVQSTNPMPVRMKVLLERLSEVISATKGLSPKLTVLPGRVAFTLGDTHGLPLEITQMVASEAKLSIDMVEYNRLFEEQQERSRAAQKKEIVVAATADISGKTGLTANGTVISRNQPTKFVGYHQLSADGTLIDIVKSGDDTFLVFDQTPFYAEMGGQAGDHGAARIGAHTFAILDVVKDKSGRHLHKLAPACVLDLAKLEADPSTSLIGRGALLGVSPLTRRAISRHHTAAHLVNWALRKVLGTHVRQTGTSKTKERLRFDFLHFEQVTHAQLHEVERLVNDKVLDNAPVSYSEVPYSDVKGRPDVLQFFGDKYGETVRVVQIGGVPAHLDGYSMELCGGTHVTTTGEIGLIKLVAEMAIAAGTRRIEAVAGQPAYDLVDEHEAALKAVNVKLNAGPLDVVHKLDALFAQKADLEKKLKAFEQKAAANLATDLAEKAQVRDGLKFVSAVVATDAPETLRSLGSQVLAKLGEGVVQLGAAFGDKATVVAFCSPAAIKAGHQAGKLVQALSVQLGGKGGGKPDFAMGGGKDVAKLAEILK